MKYKSDIQVEKVIYEQIRQDMSSYPNKTIHEDGSVTVRQVNSSYFLINDRWHLDKMYAIRQFRPMIDDFISEKSRKTIYFQFDNETLNLETKYIYFKRLFSHNWKISTVFQSLQNPLKKVTEFINEEYTTLTSFKQLKIDKAEQEYIEWLTERGITTKRVKKHLFYNDVEFHTSVVAILRILYTEFTKYANQQEEWKKDVWDVRNLKESYGIVHTPTAANYYLSFSGIQQEGLRNEIKMYFRQRLISKYKFAWTTAQNYINVISKFLAYLFEVEPDWDELKGLKRNHIQGYIHSLHEYANQFEHKKANPEGYVASSLRILRKILKDLQRYQYKCAPLENVNLLIFIEDIPEKRKKSISQIDYIPDSVLKQLFNHLDDLDKDIQIIVWLAYKTGLRASDILTLTVDCLIQMNGQYWLETELRKNQVIGHRIPIDDELACILLEKIEQTKSNENLEGLLFSRNQGSRYGLPISQGFVRLALNKFAVKHHITDEAGDIFHFTLHQFRHTYAMKLLNGGADIYTVQELLGHASIDMTMKYAKLLDRTKREVFNSVVRRGVFQI